MKFNPEYLSDQGLDRHVSHSIVSRSHGPAWLKGLALIDMEPYRRFYRQNRTSFAGAEDGEILREATLSTSSSINFQDTRLFFGRQPMQAY